MVDGIELGSGGTVKTAAQKRKEKKERQKAKAAKEESKAKDAASVEKEDSVEKDDGAGGDEDAEAEVRSVPCGLYRIKSLFPEGDPFGMNQML